MAEEELRGKISLYSWINNPDIRAILFQIILVIAIFMFGYFIISNVFSNLERQRIASGFGFLDITAGFKVNQTLINYSEISSYGKALRVGFYNTLLVAVLGIIMATCLGFLIGIARLSKNWLISSLAMLYIEIIRNVPLLLQIFFWYITALRSVPGKREKWSFFDTVHLNIAGLRLPRPIFETGSEFIAIALLVAVIAILAIRHWARRRQVAYGQRISIFWPAFTLLLSLPLLTFFVMGRPIHLEYPLFVETGPILRRGFQLGVGITLIPEFLALLIALVTYTAAFIAEIVRAGILSVDQGQTEAARALGLQRPTILRLIIIPQAMRVIIPPLTSQYLNLTKNSSLAVAVAYPDLVSVGGTILNQTGQAVEIISIWMVVYLSLSLLTALFMNWYNHHMALIEH